MVFFVQENSFQIVSNLSTVKERLSFLCMSTVLSDVTLIVGSKANNKRSFPAHRFVLGMSSPVFHQMFWSGAIVSNKTAYEFSEDCPRAFQIMLKYLYTDDLDLEIETIEEVLCLAQKYRLDHLKQSCFEFLTTNLTVDNVLRIYENATDLDSVRIEEECLQLIDEQADEILKSDQFKKAKPETVKQIVCRESLMVSELTLFKAIVDWAEEECARRALENSVGNKRTILKGILNEIRFPLIGAENFAKEVVPTALLAREQMVDLFCWFTLKDKPKIDFPIKRSPQIAGKEYCMVRFYCGDVETKFKSIDPRIHFQVDTDIYLTGIGMYGLFDASTCNVKLFVSDAKKVLTSEQFALKRLGPGKTQQINLSRVIPIKAYQSYQIWYQCDQNRWTYNGEDGESVVDVIVDNNYFVEFEFFSLDMNGRSASVESGQIPLLFFKTKPFEAKIVPAL